MTLDRHNPRNPFFFCVFLLQSVKNTPTIFVNMVTMDTVSYIYNTQPVNVVGMIRGCRNSLYAIFHDTVFLYYSLLCFLNRVSKLELVVYFYRRLKKNRYKYLISVFAHLFLILLFSCYFSHK